jgi:hypothetical protein
MNTLDECLNRLIEISRSGAADSHKIDRAVDAYLIGFGPQTAQMRMALASAFLEKAPATELAENVRARIMREDLRA